MEMKEYGIEEFEADKKWFSAFGMSEKTATDQIIYLLGRTPSKELNALIVEEKL